MRILLTGANGFIGKELLPWLLEAGYEVRALMRTRESNPLDPRSGFWKSRQGPWAWENLELVHGCLPDSALCESLCAGVDAIVHAAGLAHVYAPGQSLKRNNVQATLELAQTARNKGVKRFIFLSSVKAAYPAHSAYARLKVEAEQGLNALAVPDRFETLSLRLPLLYGRGMQGNLATLLRLLARPWLPAFPTSQTPLGMISVGDLCGALAMGLACGRFPAPVLVVDDGESYTLDRIVYHVRARLGLAQPALSVPKVVTGAVAALSGLVSPIYKSSLSMSTYNTLFREARQSDTRFFQHIGFEPCDTFYSLLDELLQDIRA